MLVKLFGGLRVKAGSSELHESGATIRDVLENICARNGVLGAGIFDAANDELQPHVRVMVNGLDSELLDGLDTAVAEGDQIAIFPPIAGG